MVKNNLTLMDCNNTQDWLYKIKGIVADSSRVVVTHHAKTRMAERNITLMQSVKVLREGVFAEEPAKSPNGDWKFTMRHHICGEFLSVAAALTMNQSGEAIVVITVFSD